MAGNYIPSCFSILLPTVVVHKMNRNLVKKFPWLNITYILVVCASWELFLEVSLKNRLVGPLTTFFSQLLRPNLGKTTLKLDSFPVTLDWLFIETAKSVALSVGTIWLVCLLQNLVTNKSVKSHDMFQEDQSRFKYNCSSFFLSSFSQQ